LPPRTLGDYSALPVAIAFAMATPASIGHGLLATKLPESSPEIILAFRATGAALQEVSRRQRIVVANKILRAAEKSVHRIGRMACGGLQVGVPTSSLRPLSSPASQPDSRPRRRPCPSCQCTWGAAPWARTSIVRYFLPVINFNTVTDNATIEGIEIIKK
jgi:hypothetical protein